MSDSSASTAAAAGYQPTTASRPVLTLRNKRASEHEAHAPPGCRHTHIHREDSRGSQHCVVYIKAGHPTWRE